MNWLQVKSLLYGVNFSAAQIHIGDLMLLLPPDDNGDLQSNLLPRSLLLMHRWYVTSTELAGKLLMIYPTW